MRTTVSMVMGHNDQNTHPTGEMVPTGRPGESIPVLNLAEGGQQRLQFYDGDPESAVRYLEELRDVANDLIRLIGQQSPEQAARAYVRRHGLNLNETQGWNSAAFGIRLRFALPEGFPVADLLRKLRDEAPDA